MRAQARSDAAHTNGLGPQNGEAGATAALHRAVSRIDAWQAPRRQLSEGLSPTEVREPADCSLAAHLAPVCGCARPRHACTRPEASAGVILSSAAPASAQLACTRRWLCTAGLSDKGMHDDPCAVTQLVTAEFNELYPGEVAAVHLVHDNRLLRKVQGEYRSTLQGLLDLVDRYASRRARHKPVKRKTARLPRPAAFDCVLVPAGCAEGVATVTDAPCTRACSCRAGQCALLGCSGPGMHACARQPWAPCAQDVSRLMS